jgi:predicted nicotinamide N-methyase
MDNLIIQLKQRIPLHYVSLEKLTLPVDEKQQNEILQTLINISETNKYYSMSIIKKLIDKFEKCSEMEIIEAYYEYLMEWLDAKPLKPTDTDLITYTFNENHEIIIQESPNLISGLGTTGLRTWEASLYLAEYLLTHNVLKESDDVLELGCGTGIVSISILKQRQNFVGNSDYGKLFITDGDSQLVEIVKNNIELNKININNYEIRKLWWGEDYIPTNVKTLIAADVTYDASVIPDLVHVLNEGISEGNVQTAYVAATKRNEETLSVWEQWLDMGVTDGTWSWSVIATNDSNGNDTSLFYGGTLTPIYLYCVQRINN